MADIHGTCADRFEPVRAALARNVDAREEIGASIVVDLDGEIAVDIWGGYRDEARTQPWERDTITNVWSTTKTVTSLAALMLVDRGELDVDAPVARYWPEFAANGKQDVLVRQLLGHTSGVSGMEQPAVTEDLYDWEKSTSRYAAQAPWWPPGTASGYHALNFGHLVGEVLRRITGVSLKEFVATEIAGPLGADFQIGAAEGDWGRIANVTPPPPLEFDLAAVGMDSPAVKTLHRPAGVGRGGEHARLAAGGHRRGERARQRPLGGPHPVGRVAAAARSTGSAWSGRRRWMSSSASRPTASTWCSACRCGTASATGCRSWTPSRTSRPGKICFWGGWGGSLILMDLDRRMTIAYMMNKMGAGIIGSDRAEQYARAIYAAVG